MPLELVVRILVGVYLVDKVPEDHRQMDGRSCAVVEKRLAVRQFHSEIRHERQHELHRGVIDFRVEVLN